MYSGFSGGGSYNTNQQQQFRFRSPLSGKLPDPVSEIRRPELIGKRSLEEFQQQNQQDLGLYLRYVKLKPNFHHTNPLSTISPVDFPPITSVSPEVSTSLNSPYGFHQQKLMNHRLLELEKELLGDEEDEEAISAVTDGGWSETIQNLISPTEKPISLSPTSSSSSCSSTSAFPPIAETKQSLIDAAAAISEGNTAAATETIARLELVANSEGSSEQRLTAFMVSALNSRVNPTAHPYSLSELYGDEHKLSTQMLYEVSPCFKLCFMAANLAILGAASEQGFQRIHVVDFDIIREGRQYMQLLYALAMRNSGGKRAAAFQITAFTDSIYGGEEKLKTVRERLETLANNIGVCFKFSVKKLVAGDLSRDKLGIQPDESLAVNLAFKLQKLPDESVTTENMRGQKIT